MADMHYLSGDDLRTLKELLARVRNEPKRPQLASPDLLAGSAPDAHVARATGGVPPRVGLVPGSADVEVMRLISGSLVGTNRFKRVNNLSEAEVEAGTLVEIGRDKAGAWWVLTPGGSAADEGTGTGTGIDAGCPSIPGVDLGALDLEPEPTHVLGLKDGCLVLIGVTQCTEDTGTGGGGSGSLADGDYGAFMVAGGVATINNEVVTPAMLSGYGDTGVYS